MSNAVISPRLFIKKTISSFNNKDNFFCDLINEFSDLKFHISFPSLMEKHLITLSKSIVKNLSLKILIKTHKS